MGRPSLLKVAVSLQLEHRPENDKDCDAPWTSLAYRL